MGQVLALAFHAHLWLLVLAPSPHSSGRGFGPRRSSGTLQLSTRCSSLALTPSRSLAVRVGWSWLPTSSASGATSGAVNPTSGRGIHATTRMEHARSPEANWASAVLSRRLAAGWLQAAGSAMWRLRGPPELFR